MQVRLQIGTQAGTHGLLTDDELGHRLVDQVRRGLSAGKAPAVATLVRPERLDLVLLANLGPQVPVNGLLSALTRAEYPKAVSPPEAIGCMGRVGLRRKQGEPPVPLAVVFLEWPDCRWWFWRGLIDPKTDTVLPHTETLHSAVEGDPLPRGLGRWWSGGRRQRGRVRFDRWPDTSPQEMVH